MSASGPRGRWSTCSNIFCLLRQPCPLTVLDNGVHVDLVGRSEDDRVSLSILVLPRFTEDHVDFGLSRQHGGMRENRTHLGLATAGKWGGGVHRGTVNQHLYLSEGMTAKGCWRGERMLRRLQENSLPLPPAPRFSSPLLRSFPFSRSSHFLTLSLLIHAVFLLNKKSKREGLTLWSGGDWKVGERETRTDMRSRRE